MVCRQISAHFRTILKGLSYSLEYQNMVSITTLRKLLSMVRIEKLLFHKYTSLREYTYLSLQESSNCHQSTIQSFQKKTENLFFFLIFLTTLTICLPYFCDVEGRGAFPESCVSYKQLSCMQYMEVSHPQLLDPCISFVFL